MRLQQTLQRFRNHFKSNRRNQPSKKRSCRLQLELLETRVVPTGTWTPLTNLTPDSSGVGAMILLSNGSVLAQGGSDSSANTWSILTPDSSGSYVNGTWSSAANSNLGRLFYGSVLLRDGRVLVVGGEYSGPSTTLNDTNTGEIYDPVANTWTSIPNYPEGNFGDGFLSLLPNGQVLAAGCCSGNQYIYNPATNTWSSSPVASLLNGDNNNEEGWVKLAENGSGNGFALGSGNVLNYEIHGTSPQTGMIFNPATNTWSSAGSVPVALDDLGELGPSVLLPNGQVFWVGASNHTALYTPSTNSWAAGPDTPNDASGNQVGGFDAPAALETNGKVLYAASPPASNFPGPTTIYEYDPSSNTTVAVPDTNGPSLGGPAFLDRMLELPSGQILFTNSGGQLFVYTPDSGPSASWAPTVTNISGNTLTGTQLNGLSEGAAYGDDAQMASNYPIIRLSGSDGITRFAKTTNWSDTGVATGSALVTTNFSMPTGATNANLMNVIANGIPSSNILYINDTTANDIITLDTFSFTFLGFTFDYITVTVNGVSSSWFVNAGAVSSVFVNMNGSNETVNVRDTWSGIPTFINSGSGADTVNIGNAGSVQGVAGNVTIENQPSYNTINIDDSNDGGPHTTTLQTVTIANDTEVDSDSFGQVTGLAPGTISYEYFDTTSLTVKTGTGGNTVDVLATGSLSGPGNRTTTLVGSSGGTTVNVGNAGSLSAINGALILENEAATDTVNINDQNDPVFQSTVTLATVSGKPYNFTGGQLSGLPGVAPITWDYSDTAQVTINTGQAGVTLTVTGTGVPTFINGNSLGTNKLVGPNAQTTWNVTGANAGNFSSAIASATFTNFQNLTGGNNEDGFIFSNGATLSGTLDGGGGGNGLSMAPYTTNLTVNITGVDAGNVPGVVGAFLNISGVATGSGNDLFVFSNGASIASIDGGGGTNTMDFSAYTSSRTVFVYGVNAGTVPGVVFEFGEIQNVTAGSGNDTFVFNDGTSLTGTIDGGPGTNTIDALPYLTGRTFSITAANGGSVAGMVGTFAHFQNLLGAGSGGNVFAFSPGGTLAGEVDGGFGGSNLLDYSAYTTGVTVNLSLNSATAVSGGVVNIQELRGGAGNDHLTGNGAGGTTFFASPGSDTITGLGTGNTLVGANITNLWSITGLDSGKLNTSSYTDIENLIGGTGLDTFKFSTTGKETSIAGGGAPPGQGDWLDYSAFTAANPVNVNLLLGTATDVTGSISGIENVIGGAGNDFLRGDNNGNILIEHGGAGTINGGTGRSLLIRGTGAATVNGGSSGDILIGGKTSYDTTNHLALMAILAEWRSTVDNYTTRTHKINHGLIPGGFKLSVGAGGTVTLSTGGALNAASGSDLDWFFMTVTQVHSALEAGEATNNVP